MGRRKALSKRLHIVPLALVLSILVFVSSCDVNAVMNTLFVQRTINEESIAIDGSFNDWTSGSITTINGLDGTDPNYVQNTAPWPSDSHIDCMKIAKSNGKLCLYLKVKQAFDTSTTAFYDYRFSDSLSDYQHIDFDILVYPALVSDQSQRVVVKYYWQDPGSYTNYDYGVSGGGATLSTLVNEMAINGNELELSIDQFGSAITAGYKSWNADVGIDLYSPGTYTFWGVFKGDTISDDKIYSFTGFVDNINMSF